MLHDNKFRLSFKEGNISVLNYVDIINISNVNIKIKTSFGFISIIGNNLKLCKIYDSECLVKGIINNIEAIYE